MAIAIDTDKQFCTVMCRVNITEQAGERAEQAVTEFFSAMADLPGFISLNLHRSTEDREMIAYLQWRTRDDHEACKSGASWTTKPKGKDIIELMRSGSVTMKDKVFEVVESVHR